MDIRVPDVIRKRAKDFFETDAIDICYPPVSFYMEDGREFRSYKVLVHIKDNTQNYIILVCPQKAEYSAFTRCSNKIIES